MSTRIRRCCYRYQQHNHSRDEQFPIHLATSHLLLGVRREGFKELKKSSVFGGVLSCRCPLPPPHPTAFGERARIFIGLSALSPASARPSFGIRTADGRRGGFGTLKRRAYGAASLSGCNLRACARAEAQLSEVCGGAAVTTALYSAGVVVQATDKEKLGGRHAGRNYYWGGCCLNPTAIAIAS